MACEPLSRGKDSGRLWGTTPARTTLFGRGQEGMRVGDRHGRKGVYNAEKEGEA